MIKYIFFIILATSTTLNANETRYVTDKLEVTMRSGQSTKHQIVRMLASGTAVEVLEIGDDNQYTRIKTGQGKKGWVLSRYLDKNSSARERLQQTQKQLQRLKNENKRLKKDLSRFRNDKLTLSKEKDSLSSQSKQLKQELNRIKRVSSDILGVDKTNRTLNSKLLTLQSNYEQAQQQISTLQDSTARDWFMVGGGVILLGIILGLLIPRIRWQKKSDWGSL